jgi:hypothetical protein
MPEAIPTPPPGAPPKFGDVLMLSDTPVLAGVIMALAQPFAQVRETLGLPQWTPLLVAAIASLLVALYHVLYRRSSTGREAWLLAPLITLILFSAAVGANNLVDAARQGASRPEQAAPDAQQVKVLREQLQVVQAQLDSERALRQTLQEAMGVPASPADRPAPQKSSTDLRGLLARMADWLIPDAAAQTAEQRRRVQEALKRYEEEQRKLKEQEERLKQEAQRQEQQQSAPLWKTW